MITRRNFFKDAGATGIVFCSCGLGGALRAEDVSTPRPYTAVAGKHVKTIDVHAHCYFQDALELMGPEWKKILPPTKGVPEHFLAVEGGVEQRLRQMDAMAIDMEILSINPYWYEADRDRAAEICRIQNEHLSELCGKNPDRFGAFASLTLQDPSLAVEQLERAVKRQGLKGAAVAANVAGEELASPRFHPVWAKAEELGAVLFVHPMSTPELSKRWGKNGWLWNVIGNPLDTSIALQRLIFDGTLDRFPGLKVLAAHGGGYFASYAPRSDHSCFVSPQSCDPSIRLKKKPTEYARQIHYDALVFTPEALRHLVAEVGASQVMLGTDCPIPWELHPVDHVLGTTTLSDDEKLAILGGNAARLLQTNA